MNPNNAVKGEKHVTISRVKSGGRETIDDIVAVEEPLEIRVVYGPKEKRRSKSLSITMRTPGNDEELAAGFLLSENVVNDPIQIESFEHVGPPPEEGLRGNTLMVELAHDVTVAIEKLQRHFYTTSSCGVCGKASLDAIRNQGMQPISDSLTIDSSVVFGLPGEIRKQQDVFESTGGLHAAALVNSAGKVLAIREDVGRHNAVDKVIGSRMMGSQSKNKAAEFPLGGTILVVSGRASFELMQKALMARIPMLVAVGAPSSLAVELASEFNMTLIGFTSGERFNIYSGSERVADRK